jgi:outer membrane beta-barrel protein
VKRAVMMLLSLWSGASLAQTEEIENPGAVAAIQERRFRMGHELTLGGGVLPLDAFYKGFIATVSYTNHFSDHFAWQVGRGSYSYNVDTGLRDQLERDFNVLPTQFEEVQWMVGSDIIWSPLYGKAAWVNQRVLYFELFGLLGGSVLKMTSGFRPAANIGVGARFFTSQNVSFRFDLTDNIVIFDRILNVPTLQLSVALNFGASE